MTDDLKARLDALHVWPQAVADAYAAGLTPRQIDNLYAVGKVATEAADRIATLEAALADMTQQRDAAMAGAVKVKPLAWSQVNTYGSKDVWDAIGGGHVYRIIKRADGTYWLTDPSCGSPYHKNLSACQDAANALHELRARAMWQPDPDRMLVLTAAAEAQAEARGMRKAADRAQEIADAASAPTTPLKFKNPPGNNGMVD